jgi:lipoprotein-anchoring transpeptidase ErfK/SrfK
MQLRSFILAGVAAVLCLGAPANAAMPASNAAAPASKTEVFAVAAKSPAAELKALKNKKKPTEQDLARIKELEKQVKAEREAAKAKALEVRKLALREAAKAKAQAARESFLASKGQKAVAEARTEKPATKTAKAIEPVRPLKPIQEAEDDIPPEAMSVALSGNNGELRSEAAVAPRKSSSGLFAGLFGGTSSTSVAYLPETRALDSVLAKKQAKKPFKVRPEFEPQVVEFSGYEPGTIVINTAERRLYLVDSRSTARRYAIAVGREGLQFKGTTTVGDKQEWPRWIPTKEMQQREPKKYGQYKDGMAGGPDNPLGARAIYLYQGKKDTHLRIHGTNQPQTIGTSASNGCFRMINEHVMDLYRRVRIGAPVVIL